MQIICDRCRKKFNWEKIIRTDNEYLCEECLKKKLTNKYGSDINVKESIKQKINKFIHWVCNKLTFWTLKLFYKL